MANKQEIVSADFAGLYKEIAELIGVEATIILHENFKGQQITLPKKLYTKAYILRQIPEGADADAIKRIAAEFGYTERRIRQLLKENAKMKGHL